ncbi:MAG: chromosome segregation protein SMC, partial [Gemmatimonadetes bacterium]
FGFKSFADKTEVQFSPGVTAIVGPNGCGKSNIVDAVKWVLGEQGAKSLRGKQMQDVIFSGTQHRHPLSLAEVSLYVDNSDKRLPIDYNEVVISRRLYRSGESEYLINKNPCRLRDIVELFLDTGIGSRAYSLIEQGMIGAILSADTGERRRLFDEAAGIQKYKVRKKNALQKLTITEDHLVRINDLIAEVEKRVNALKRQVGKARRFLRLKTTVKEAEIRLAHQRFLRDAHAYAEAHQQKIKLDQKLATLQTQQTQLEARLEQQHAHLLELRHQLSQAQTSRDKRAHEINQLERQQALDRERLTHFTDRTEQDQREIAALESKLTSIETRKTQLLADLNQATQELDQIKKEITTHQTEKTELETAVAQAKQRVEQAKAQQLQAVHRQAQHQNEHQNLQKQLERLKAERSRLSTEIERLEHDKIECTNCLKNHRDRREHLEAEYEHIQEKLNRLNHDLQTAKNRLNALRQHKNEVYTEWKTAHSRHEILQNLKDNYEGYQPGVKSLLTEDHGISGIIGTVGDVLTVDPAYEHAWEVALADLLQVVVTETDAAMEAALHYLNRRQCGRVMFISLERARRFAQHQPPPPDTGLTIAAGVAQTIDPRFQDVLTLLLGEVVFTVNLAEALQQAETTRNGWKYIAQSGEMADSTGRVSGGFGNQTDGGILQRNRQLRRLNTQITELEDQLYQLEIDEEQQAETVENLRLEREQTQNDSRQVERQIATARGEESKWELELSKIHHRQENWIQQQQQIDTQRAELQLKLEQLETALTHFASHFAEVEAEVIEAEAQFQTIRTERDERLAALNQLEVQHVRAESHRHVLEKDLHRLQRAKKETREKINRYQREIEEAGQKTKQLHIAIRELTEQISQRMRQHALATAEVNQLQEQVASAQGQVKTMEQQLSAWRREASEVQQQDHALDIEQTQYKAKMDAAIDYIWRTYRLELKEMAGEMEPAFDPAALEQEIAAAQEKLAKMGAVNETAPQEYEEEHKRLEFLTTQRQDLLDARQQLDDTVNQINRKAQEMFTATFADVNAKFQQVFAQLFPGGEANLQLEAGVDPLEADVQIFARPFGKRLQEMTLLSGGERAMTAIALLFAIYLVKPSPFCILDEVDAPLDDANIHRFTAMLKDFAQETQFIIITHNKETMMVCDRLFGVTMEEAGVSKMISVELKN